MSGERTGEPPHFAVEGDGDGEESARADTYGLIAELFLAPPGDSLLARLRAAPVATADAGAFLDGSWRALVGAAARLDGAAVRREFDALFQGLGKAEIFPYASFFVVGRLHERPLVELRATLAELGLERADDVAETEDHIASVCEVMRFLIAGDDAATSNLAVQRRFFDAHLRPWAEALCAALVAHPSADFYAAAAGFARDFFAVEAQAFDMLEA